MYTDLNGFGIVMNSNFCTFAKLRMFGSRLGDVSTRVLRDTFEGVNEGKVWPNEYIRQNIN